jgi:integrase
MRVLCRARFSRWRGSARTGSELQAAEIPIIPLLRRILDGVEHKSGWLFANTKGGAIDLHNIAYRNIAYRLICPRLKAAGLAWRGWHRYRRGLASNLKALGVVDLTIQRIMRHTDVDTTRRAYIKVRDTAVENAMRALESACTAFVQPDGVRDW